MRLAATRSSTRSVATDIAHLSNDRVHPRSARRVRGAPSVKGATAQQGAAAPPPVGPWLRALCKRPRLHGMV
jgi:hypothetical protein